MRLRKIKGAAEAVSEHPRCLQAEDCTPGTWHERFGNARPIHLEIGMGKGQFIMAQAGLHPDINYIGIERFDSVTCRALQKYDEEPLGNLWFLSMDAEKLCDVFGEHEVDRIYLNFSDPWPKDRHAKRRLTSGRYLERYDRILVPEGRLEFKTDNRDLFEFSVEQAKAAGWHLDAVTRDLHHDAVLNEGNIMTEYETKFSALGSKICKMIISRNV